MDEPNFITLRDAAELVGVSKKTIENRYKNYIKDVLKKDIKEATEIVQTSMQGKQLTYLINEKFVREHIMEEGSDGSKKSKGVKQGDNPYVRLLEDQLDKREEESKEQKSQITTLTNALAQSQKNLQNQQVLHKLALENAKNRGLKGFVRAVLGVGAESTSDVNNGEQGTATPSNSSNTTDSQKGSAMTIRRWIIVALVPVLAFFGYQLYLFGAWVGFIS